MDRARHRSVALGEPTSIADELGQSGRNWTLHINFAATGLPVAACLHRSFRSYSSRAGRILPSDRPFHQVSPRAADAEQR